MRAVRSRWRPRRPSLDEQRPIFRHGGRHHRAGPAFRPRRLPVRPRRAGVHDPSSARRPSAPAAPECHVSGQQLLEGVRQYALLQFGPMVPTVFEHWRSRPARTSATSCSTSSTRGSSENQSTTPSRISGRGSTFTRRSSSPSARRAGKRCREAPAVRSRPALEAGLTSAARCSGRRLLFRRVGRTLWGPSRPMISIPPRKSHCRRLPPPSSFRAFPPRKTRSAQRSDLARAGGPQRAGRQRAGLGRHRQHPRRASISARDLAHARTHAFQGHGDALDQRHRADASRTRAATSTPTRPLIARSTGSTCPRRGWPPPSTCWPTPA